nr:FGGY-family carbohydrate kinase [Clostridium paraputrificum]
MSSGTWSLIGTELKEANCSLKSKEYNITNEGGYAYRFRFLKNVIGLWMIQCIAEEYNNKYSFGELCNMAKEASISSIVDVYDNAFLAPESMIKEVQNYCEKTNQEIPETPSEIARVIYRSLAKGYKKAIEEIEEVTGKEYKEILIVGGGSNAEFLNEITAKETGKIVYAGPGEATAIGNLLVQMISSKEIKNLKEGREKVKESFKVKVYKGEE